MIIDYATLFNLAQDLSKHLERKKYSLTTAESCTGGLLAHILTSVPACSSWFERGYVTYSRIAKLQLLNVAQETLDHYGAVSKQVATEMAVGAITNSQAQCALAITGIAGPDKEKDDPSVGTCWFGWSIAKEKTITEIRHFSGDRSAINYQAAKFSLSHLIILLDQL